MSSKAFEEFLKFTAVALIARDVALRRSRQAQSALSPWMELAADLFVNDPVASRIEAMAAVTSSHWQEIIASGAGHGLSLDAHALIREKLMAWFKDEIEPLISQRRAAVVNARVAASLVARKEGAVSVRMAFICSHCSKCFHLRNL